MHEYTADLDFAATLSAPRRCPSCGRRTLVARPHDGSTEFHCAECDTGWSLAFGVARKSVVTHPGTPNDPAPSESQVTPDPDAAHAP